VARLLFGPRREWAGNKQSGKQAKRQRSKLAASLRGDLIQRGKPLHELLAREKFPQGRPFLFGAAHLRALFAPLFLSLSLRRHFLLLVLLVSCPPVSPSERDTAPSAHGRHNGNNNNKSANHPAAHCQLSAAALHASNGPAGGRSGRVQTLFSITRLVPLVLQSSSRDELADELADLLARSLADLLAHWRSVDTIGHKPADWDPPLSLHSAKAAASKPTGSGPVVPWRRRRQNSRASLRPFPCIGSRSAGSTDWLVMKI